MFTPELLSPAGSLKNMRYAFAYGADAVYAGQPRYSLRVRNNEFNHENLAKGIQEAHDLGKKFYVVVNIAPHNAKLKTFIRDLTPVIEMVRCVNYVRPGSYHDGTRSLPCNGYSFIRTVPMRLTGHR